MLRDSYVRTTYIRTYYLYTWHCNCLPTTAANYTTSVGTYRSTGYTRGDPTTLTWIITVPANKSSLDSSSINHSTNTKYIHVKFVTRRPNKHGHSAVMLVKYDLTRLQPTLPCTVLTEHTRYVPDF